MRRGGGGGGKVKGEGEAVNIMRKKQKHGPSGAVRGHQGASGGIRGHQGAIRGPSLLTQHNEIKTNRKNNTGKIRHTYAWSTHVCMVCRVWGWY